MAKVLKWSSYVRATELIKNRFTTIGETVDEIASKETPPSMAQVRRLSAFSKELSQKRSDFENNLYRILESEESDMTILSKDQDSINNLYADITSKIEALSPTADPQTPTSTHSAESHSAPYVMPVRLPKLELKQFSGDPLTWIAFINLFDSTIHTNVSLNNVAKFQYLLSVLSGEPLNLIKSLNLSAANYTVAYKLLLDRYHSPRRLVTLHLNQLLDLPSISASSPKTMRSFVNLYHENSQALKALDCDVTAHKNPLLSALILRKMDNALRQRLEVYRSTKTEEGQTSHTLPEVGDIIKFLTEECNHVEDANLHSIPVSSRPSTNYTQPKGKRVHFGSNPVSMVATSTSTSQSTPVTFSCFVCKQQSHKVYTCPKYSALNSNQRYKLIKESKRCTSCLGNHSLQQCKSKATCQRCHKRHHTSLHFEGSQNNSQGSQNTVKTDALPCSSRMDSTQRQEAITLASAHSTSTTQTSGTTVLLGTTLVKLTAQNGVTHVFRALLDSGSMCELISERAAKLLIAPRMHSDLQLVGLSKIAAHTKGSVFLNIETLSGKIIATDCQVHVLDNISVDLPRRVISPEVLRRVKPYTLADPTFHLPGPVDMLIGGSLFSRILTNESHSLGDHMPHVLGTHFGFVVIGSTPSVDPHPPVSSVSISLLATSDDLHNSLQRFWQIEEPPMVSKKSVEEQRCDMHFDSTHSRREDGRYVVQLPFKEGEPELGNSFQIAERRLKSLERKFAQSPELKNLYCKSIKDHLDQGHMVKLDNLDLSSPHYFLPHHGVVKGSGEHTKLRIVYDASCKTTSGKSLNDTLMTGRRLFTDICDILLNFRSHRIVFTCDIRQMYLQIFVDDSQQNFQLLLWRDTDAEPISTYRSTRVTFGVNCSPFLAIRTLHQLAIDEGATYPKAAEVIRTSTYVDDIISGADTVNEALELQGQLISLLAKGGFELRKWTSNSQKLLQELPQECLETPVFLQEDPTPHSSVLGLKWSPENDYFTYRVDFPPDKLTKRSVLSAIAKIYDPCGFLAPCIMAAKCFMQLLWTTNLGWDEQLPPDLSEKWNTFIFHASHISKIKVPRALMLSSSKKVEVHGFSDASESGYAAVVYFRILLPNDKVVVRQVMAKTRVAPLKRVTLPRLELCGAHLLTQLVTYVCSVFNKNIPSPSIYLWCDSTVVLTWLQTPPYRLKTFVANRVSQVQELIPSHCWRHIQGSHNPADCASRGILASDLVDHPLWWKGPSWLHLNEEAWPSPKFSFIDLTATDEVKNTPLPVLSAVEQKEWDLLTKFSSWTRLQAVMAYVKRFVYNARHADKYHGPLSPDELNSASTTLFRLVQLSSFQEDILALERKKEVSSRIRRLSPWLDPDHLLRVGGRLTASTLRHDSRHPVILPKGHHVVDLLIDHYHIKHLHAGAQLTQALLAQSVWILSARSAIRSRIFKCLRCFRLRPKNSAPLMGDLPKARVTSTRAFLKTGMDYGGPFSVKVHNLRSIRHIKVYICVFVCLATKAVHVEVVTDLSTDAFIAALTRFVSRRGLCSDLYSDCATNFVGADNALRKLIKTTDHTQVQTFAAQQGIKFHFNPPAAPHQGGLWESAIKGIKHHLRRVIGDQVLTLQEFITITTQAEAMLNSRPLTPLSNDPTDLSALTPGHFLIGTPLAAVPEADLSNAPQNRLKHWHLVQSLGQQIWKRWHLEYLHTLQQRGKWDSSTQNLKIGDLVLIHQPTPPLTWPLARITGVYPGKDSVVRVVQLRTANGQLIRPSHKVFPLPCNED